MQPEAIQFAIIRESSASFDATVATLRTALAEQGFGIMSEIDVAATLKAKLGVDHPRTLILGACNPPLALRALTAVPDISVFMPCNVVVREREGKVEVAAINPPLMAMVITHPEVVAITAEAERRLRLVLEAVG